MTHQIDKSSKVTKSIKIENEHYKTFIEYCV